MKNVKLFTRCKNNPFLMLIKKLHMCNPMLIMENLHVLPSFPNSSLTSSYDFGIKDKSEIRF